VPRKGPAPKHPVVVDPVYGAPIVTSLINKVLLDVVFVGGVVGGAFDGLEVEGVFGGWSFGCNLFFYFYYFIYCLCFFFPFIVLYIFF
jgi:hypothetical protein